MLKHIVFVSVISLVRCRAAIGLEAMSPYLLTAEKSNCKFSTHLCKPSSLSLVKTVINITSITGCQNMCAKEKSPKCKFVTLTNFRNITSCHLLTNCDDKVLTLCLSSTSNTLHVVLTLNINCCPLIELERKVIRRFAKISQSRRRPLLGPFPGWKHQWAFSH